MSTIAGLAFAEQRMAAYLDDAGAVAMVSRKVGDQWLVIESDVPIMVSTRGARGMGIDPAKAGENDIATRNWMAAKSADIQKGDRITIIAPRGSGIEPGQVLTISAIHLNSMAPALAGIASVEDVAVERYPITVERWMEQEEAYVPILSAVVSVVASTGTARSTTMGAAGSQQRGVAIFEPVPGIIIEPRDSIVGIPWAPGAFVQRVYPVVGSRLEVAFEFTSGVM